MSLIIENHIDLLKLYTGNSIKITEHFIVHVPTLRQVIDFGESRYFSVVTKICATGADLKWQLADMGVDYTKIDDYTLFYKYIAPTLSCEEMKLFLSENIDFSKMRMCNTPETDDVSLVQSVISELKTDEFENKKNKRFFNFNIRKNKDQEVGDSSSFNETEIIFNRLIYDQLVAIIRSIHGLKRNDEMPANEATKEILIEDARYDYQMKKDKPFNSQLFPMISSMVNNCNFKHNEKTVLDMTIFCFLDSVKRVSKIENSKLLLQSGYSGFGIDLKKVDKEQINWMCSLY